MQQQKFAHVEYRSRQGIPYFLWAARTVQKEMHFTNLDISEGFDHLIAAPHISRNVQLEPSIRTTVSTTASKLRSENACRALRNLGCEIAENTP